MDITWSGILGPDPSGCEVTLVDNGTDWGARINAADVALGAKAGAICCQGGGNIASQIILNSGASSLRTLRFGANATWTSLITSDTETILAHDNTLIEGSGWTSILQEPAGGGIMLVPGTPTLVASTTGGTLATGTYYYKVTALDGLNETTPSGEASVAVTGPTGSVAVTWQGSWQVYVGGVVHYKVYRGTSAGAENVYYLRPFTSQTTETYTDTGAVATSGTPPGVNLARTSLPLSYFLIRPYGTHVGGANQVNNISVRNIQLLGMPGKSPNGVTATVNTGLLNGGTYQNIFFNATHAIGLTVGETNVNNNAVCQDVVVKGCKFVNVGGGVPPDFPGGGGVTFAIVNGNRITVDGNTFIDALGNAVIDLEPNTGNDPVTNVMITNNLIDQRNTTGTVENAYGIASHGQGGPFGPITITGNTFCGLPYTDGVGWYPTSNLQGGIYLHYPPAGTTDNHVVENNTIQWAGGYGWILDGSNDNTIRNNRVTGPNSDCLVGGTNNVIDKNYVVTYASQGAYFYGIKESGAGSDFNTFTNNQTVTTPPVTIIGPHSTQSGNTTVPRPPYP